ncbi:MAG: MBG domain-containing protein, partial [Bacteroidota bacterium]
MMSNSPLQLSKTSSSFNLISKKIKTLVNNRLMIRSVASIVFLLIFLQENSIAQKTVFTDNFDRGSGTSSAMSNGGTPSMTYATGTTSTVTTGAPAGSITRLNQQSGSNYSAQILSGETTGTTAVQTAGLTYFNGAVSNFAAGYNSTLNSNTSEVVWTLHMKTNRGTANPFSGWGAGSYAGAFVLGCTNNSFTSGTGGNGYAVSMERAGASGTNNNFRLVKFTGGINGTRTNVIITDTTVFKLTTAQNQDWVSIKVSFTPGTNTWKLFLRDDGATANTDFSSGLTQIKDTVSKATSVRDSTYTKGSLPYFGGIFNHSTGASYTGNTLFFDNITVSLNTPTIYNPSASSLTGFIYGFGTGPSTSQSVKVGGRYLTSNLSVTSTANYEIATSSGGTYSSSLSLTPVSGTVDSTLIYVRLIQGLGVASYNSDSIKVTATNAATLAGRDNAAVLLNGSVSNPSISLSPTSISNFAGTAVSANSTSQSITVTGVSLGTDSITVTPPTNFQISKDNSTWSTSSFKLSPAGATLYIRFSPTGTGAIAGSISFSATSSTNSPTLSVTGSLTTYYYRGSSVGNLESTSSWTGNADLTSGSAPADFTTAGVTYKITTNATTTGAWTVSGSGSKIILGDPSVAADTLTISTAGAITGTIDILGASSGSNNLVLQNATYPTFGSLNAGSTVTYNGSKQIVSSTPTYGNLTINSTDSIFLASALTVNNLTVRGSGKFVLDNRAGISRTLTVSGNYSVTGTGGLSYATGQSSTFAISLTGAANTAVSSATGSDYSKSNIAITGAYTLAGNFEYPTTVASRVISGAGSLDLSSYTLNLYLGYTTLSTITTSSSSILKTGSTSSTNIPYPSGRTWSGTVEFTALGGGSYLQAGTYNNVTFDNTSGIDSSRGDVVINGTLTTTASGTVDMAAYAITGTLSGLSNAGTLKTANLSSAPYPSGKTWGGTVFFVASSGGQSVMGGTYNNLTIANSSGIDSARADLTVNGAFVTSVGTIDMSTYALLGAMSSVTNNGYLKTSNTSSTPIPASKTWGGTVEFAGSSIIVPSQTSYNNLIITSATDTAHNNITINGDLTISGIGRLIGDNASTRQVTVAGNLSSTGTGGILNNGGSQSFSFTLSGVSKTISVTSTNNNFGKTNFNITGSYTLNSDFTFTGAIASRYFGGSGSVDLSGRTLDLQLGYLNSTTTTTNSSTIIKTQNTNTASPYGVPSGKTWNGAVRFNATNGLQFIPAGTFNDLYFDNTSGVDSLRGNVTVNGTLALGSSVVATTSAFKAIANSTLTRGTGWINGNLQKSVSTPATYSFEVGDANYYTPASLVVSAVTTSGNLVVAAKTGLSSQSAVSTIGLNTSTALNRYFSLTSPDGFAGTYAGTYTYSSASDLLGSPTISALRSAINTTGATWVYPGTVSGSTSSTVTVPSTSSIGDVAFATVNNITVTAVDASKALNASDPSFTYNITSGSLLNSDVFTGSLTRASGETAGLYQIQQGTLAISPNSNNYSITFVTGTFTILGDANPITNLASSHKSNNIVRLTWTAPLGTYDNVIIFARPTAVTHTPSGNGADYNNANSDISLAGVYSTDNYLVYSGTGNSVEITSLTNLTDYNFVVYSYNGATFSTSSSLNVTTAVAPTTSLAAAYGNAQSALSWTNPVYFTTQSNYWDEVMIVAKSGSDVDQTPSGDGTAYTASAAFGSGTDLGSGSYVVYKGTGTSATITNLTNATAYYFKTFVRHGSSWSVAQSANVTPNVYAAGDFGSYQSGMWGATANWRQWSSVLAGWTVVPSVVPAQTDNVFILSGHTIRTDNTTRSCNNLTVSGTLRSDSLVNKVCFLKVYGSTIDVKAGAAIGTTLNGNSADGISLDVFNGNMTITGSGTVNFSRVRLSDSTATSTLTIDNDVKVHYHGSTNAGNAGAIYTNSPMPTSYTVTHVLTINAGKTLTFDQFACYTPLSGANNNGVTNKTFNINGTMTFLDGQISGNTATPSSAFVGNQNGYFNLGASTNYTSTINIGAQGTLNVSEFYPNGTQSGDAAGTGTVATVNVASGGSFTVSKIADFRNVSQTVTGAGSFTLSSGGVMRIGSADGITTSSAAGPIRTTTRTYNSGLYKYESAVAQVTGSGLPSTVSGLTVNNAAGLTLSGSTIVSDSLTLTSGVVTTSSNTLTSNGITNRTSGWVAGNLKKPIAVAATSKTFEIGGATSYRPISLTLNGVTVAGNLTAIVSQADGAHPNISTSNVSRTKRLNRYWTITNDGVALTSYNATFTFVSADILNSATTSSFIAGRYNSAWSYPTVGTKTSTSTQITGATSFGDFQIGENCANASTETLTSCDSLLWHGTMYYASNTTATWTGTNAAGCDSIVTLNLTINATPAAPSVDVANNCGTSTLSTTAPGTLLWSNSATTSSIIVSAGTYTVTTTVNGCVSLAGSGLAAPKTTPATPTVNVVNNCDGTSTLST